MHCIWCIELMHQVFHAQCLEHRHSFVRRNAVLAINALYKLPKGEMLLQDAPELIERVLQVRSHHGAHPS